MEGGQAKPASISSRARRACQQIRPVDQGLCDGGATPQCSTMTSSALSGTPRGSSTSESSPKRKKIRLVSTSDASFIASDASLFAVPARFTGSLPSVAALLKMEAAAFRSPAYMAFDSAAANSSSSLANPAAGSVRTGYPFDSSKNSMACLCRSSTSTESRGVEDSSWMDKESRSGSVTEGGGLAVGLLSGGTTEFTGDAAAPVAVGVLSRGAMELPGDDMPPVEVLSGGTLGTLDDAAAGTGGIFRDGAAAGGYEVSWSRRRSARRSDTRPQRL